MVAADDSTADFVESNIQKSREPEMSIVVWPWVNWVLGFASLFAACFLVGYCKETRQLTKTAVVAIALLFAFAVAFLMFSSIEIFEGRKVARAFFVRKASICTNKVTKVKWSQIKHIDIAMGGQLSSYNNTIHYRIDIETVTGGKLRCLETSDRKKAKERLILIRMFMGKPAEIDEMEVQNKTANQKQIIDKQKQMKIAQM